ncbi:hypothetical protein ACQ86N_31685 [Puia sp. P3]|uniref:hypothetical protein n=1 Tax=Puia sp. P3 TaxID=3423952 RepID=UPI003D663C8E
MKMALHDLVMNRIRMVYKDTVTGNDVEVFLGHNETKLDTLDVAGGRYGVPSIEVSGLRGRVIQGRPLTRPAASSIPEPREGNGREGARDDAPTKSSSAPPLLLRLGRIGVKDSYLEYGSGEMRAEVKVGELAAQVKRVDLEKMGFEVSRIEADSTDLRYDDNSQKKQKRGMDYAHLAVKGLGLSADNFSYSADSISGHISRGEFSEQSGFRLDQLQTRFFYSDRRVWLKDLLVRTPGSLLQRAAAMEYDSVMGIVKHPARTRLDVDLVNSKVQVRDILYFAPFLASQPAFANPSAVWNIDARTTGTLDVLNIQRLRFSGIRDLRLDVTGKLLHPMDTSRISADLNIRQLSGSRDALVGLLPKGVLPANIEVPSRFDLRGKVAGNMEGFQTDMVLNTSSGMVRLKGYMRQFRSASNASYDLVLDTKGLNLGKILKDSVYGAATAHFTVKGKGYDQHTANAVFSGRVHSAVYRGYAYEGAAIDGSLADQHAELKSSINSTAVHFELEGSADLSRKWPALKLDWQVDTVDMFALHLLKDTMAFRGHVHADFADINPDSLQGDLKLYGVGVTRGVQHLSTDTVSLVASRDNDIQNIVLRSEAADINWKGKYRLTETGVALQHVINRYYRLNGYKDTSFAAQDWTMTMHFRPSPLVLALMPSLKNTDSLGGIMVFNSDRDDLRLDLRTPRVVVGGQRFHNVGVHVATADGQLNYAIGMTDGNGSGLEFYRTSLGGYLKDNHLVSSLVLRDRKDKERYRLSGQLDKLDDGLKFVLNPDSLVLNYDRWQVNTANYFYMTPRVLSFMSWVFRIREIRCL